MLTPYRKLRNFRESLLKKRTIREMRVSQILKQINLGFIEEKIICPYIVDFFIPRLRLAVEIDGAVHNRNIQKEKDYKKDEYILSIGIMIHRFRNEDSDEYIIKKLLEYPKYSKNGNIKLNSTIHQINSLFNQNEIKIRKTTDIKHLIVDYCFNKHKLFNNKNPFYISKNNLRYTNNLSKKFFK